MAVGGQYNSVVMQDAVLQNLNLISVENGYQTDIEIAKQPDYSPFLGAGRGAELNPLVKAEPTPCILMWIDSIIEAGPANTQEDRPAWLGWFLIVCKRESGVQRALMALCEDHRKCLRGNPRQSYPNSSLTNVWGVNSEPMGQPTYDFGYESLDTSGTLAIAASMWRFGYRFPRSTG